MDINRLVELQNKITELKKKTCELEKTYNLNIDRYYYDPDSSPKAWKYFFDVYGDILECNDSDKKNLLMRTMTLI